MRDPDDYENIAEQFKGNLTFPAGDDLSAEEFVANMKAIKGLNQAATTLAREMELDPGDAATLASVGEFLLEGLYVNNRLSKYNEQGKDVLQEIIAGVFDSFRAIAREASPDLCHAKNRRGEEVFV